ncbi:MAG: LacI family DNA-binding transcriptional regulator [Hespellia sp.]|nr:LacI family DNA-binding transcriptional regulator [Hespellia sp.]
MSKKKVTSTDVAQAAGVSQATVSMVLNKKYNVSFSKDVIQKVEKAAQELGYVVPKRKAQRENKREKLIVVFCPNLSNPYYVMLLQGIESQAAEAGFGIFICNTQRNLELEERFIRLMPSLNPEGIIYTCNPSVNFMERIQELTKTFPIVVINNQNERLAVDAVDLNNLKLGKIMAQHLLELGHQKVAYVSTALTKRQKQRSKRMEGFLEEYQAAGYGDYVIVKSASKESDASLPGVDSEYLIGYHLTKELLFEHPEVTAIAGMNDMVAFGIMDALAEAKLKIPGDISVMGCDNTLFGKLRNVELTTVEHFVIYKGRDACDIIMKKIKTRRSKYAELEPVSVYHVEYEPKIIVRGTTSYPRKK